MREAGLGDVEILVLYIVDRKQTFIIDNATWAEFISAGGRGGG